MKRLMMIALVAFVAEVNAFAGVGTALVSRPLEKAVVREIAEEAAKAGVKSAATRTMSSALAGLTAKKAMGIGVGVGAAVALPVSAHEISDGEQEKKKAEADATRKISEAVAKVIPAHPELAGEISRKMTEGAQSGFGGIERKILGLIQLIAWGIGIVVALYLGGILIKAFGFVRHEVKMVFAPLPSEPSSSLQRSQERDLGAQGSVRQ